MENAEAGQIYRRGGMNGDDYYICTKREYRDGLRLHSLSNGNIWSNDSVFGTRKQNDLELVENSKLTITQK